MALLGREALRTMKEEDPQGMGVRPLAQIRLLQSLLTPARHSSEPQILPTEHRHMPAVLQSASSPNSQPGERVHLDPLFHLLPPKKASYLAIIKYIGTQGQVVEEEVWTEKGTSLVLKSGKTASLMNVSPMQWCGASIKIMTELVRHGKLKPHEVFDYLSYMVKVTELSAIYKWHSVLRYDDLYRQAQADNNFRWGCDSPHVDRVTLQAKEDRREKKVNFAPEQPFCINFQHGKCGYGQACRFKHACNNSQFI